MYSLTTLALYTGSPCYSLPCRHYGDNPFFPCIHSWHINKPFLSLAYKASWIAYTELPASSEGCPRRSPDSLREWMLMLQGESVTNRFLNPKSFGKILSVKINKLYCISSWLHAFLLSRQHKDGRSLAAMLRWVFLAEMACLNLKKSYILLSCICSSQKVL